MCHLTHFMSMKWRSLNPQIHQNVAIAMAVTVNQNNSSSFPPSLQILPESFARRGQWAYLPSGLLLIGFSPGVALPAITPFSPCLTD